MEIVIDWKVGQKRGTQIPPCLGAGSFSWGMIVLSQEQTKLSPTIGSYQKKNERMGNAFLKILEQLVKEQNAF